MGVRRWASAAALALALAVVPGVLRLQSATPIVTERPPLASLGRVEPPSVPVSDPVPIEVAITPPGALVGAPAVPAAPPPSFAPAPRPGDARGEVFALVIGIDDYPGRRADLGSAVADADTVDAALAGFEVPAGNRVVLRDGQARRDDVVAAVQSLVAQGDADDTLVLAYAGHVRKLDRDTEALVLADGGSITDAELGALLAPAAGRMWILLATCFAGGFTELLAPGRVLTGAADARHYAYESPSLNASFLVHYLVREAWLEGAAGPSVQDAFAYADAALARDHPNRRPVQLGDIGRPMILGPGDPQTAPAPRRTPPSSGPPPAPASASAPTTTTTRPDPDDGCLLGVLCSRGRGY